MSDQNSDFYFGIIPYANEPCEIYVVNRKFWDTHHTLNGDMLREEYTDNKFLNKNCIHAMSNRWHLGKRAEPSYTHGTSPGCSRVFDKTAFQTKEIASRVEDVRSILEQAGFIYKQDVTDLVQSAKNIAEKLINP
jgi:hypothetical protein